MSARSAARSCFVGRWCRESSALERFGDVEVLWDDLLRRGTRQPAFRVVRAGTTIAAGDVTRRAGHRQPRPRRPGRPPTRSSTATARGDTVVLQGLHHTNPHLARLANNLALALDHPVQVNAYLSPSNARGLDLHFDYHDVFVVQLGGSKRWRVWAPLPRTTNPVKGRHSIAAPRLDELGDPLLDLTIERRRLPVPSTRLSARGRDGRPALGPPHDRLGGGDVAAGPAQGDRRRGRGGPADRLAAGRAARAWRRGADRGHRCSTACAGAVAPETLRHWMAREIWRRQPATRLRPRSRRRCGSRPLDVHAGTVALADDDRRPRRARARRSAPRHAGRGASTSCPRCSTPNARSNPKA